MNEGYWYVASPYTHEDEGIMANRCRIVQNFCAYCANEGILVYSPIAHWHPIAVKHGLPRDHGFWRAMDRALINGSRGILVLKIKGWETSRGVQEEIEFASQYGLTIQFWEYNGGEPKLTEAKLAKE